MRDANGSRFALLLGQHDWAGCTLLDALGEPGPTLGSVWADRIAEEPLSFDTRSQSVVLSTRVARFRSTPSDVPPNAVRRLGAAADAFGSIYWIADGGQRIDTLSSGSRRVSVLWSMLPAALADADSGEFGPADVREPPPQRFLRGLAVTCEHYLVAGLLPHEGRGAGLMIFDLRAGGPPLTIRWPRAWPFVPHDIAARPCGGVAILDREHARVWLLDRRLGMRGIHPVEDDVGLRDDFGDRAVTSPPDASEPMRTPWFDLASDAMGGADPVSIVALDDDAIVVMDGAGSDGYALLSLYGRNGLVGRASTENARDIIDRDDVAGFVFRGFDCELVSARNENDPPRVIVASHEGNQCIAFELVRGGSPAFTIAPVTSFLPMRRFGGIGLVRIGAGRIDADTGLVYDSRGTWLPLVEQHRPRYAPEGALTTPALDGGEPACVWHRLMLDGCIPSGCKVLVATRAADRESDLGAMPFFDEPEPVLRPDGSELPWLLDGPAAATDAARGRGCWELLFQRARGRYLQIRLTLTGDELATPHLFALRAWYPRFSYSERYLPAVYREDESAANFIERFLANFEGVYTALEDRIAAAAALFDVRSAPADTLEWLAGWLGLVFDPAIDEARRRQLIRYAIPLYEYRGTTQGVRLAVQLTLSECAMREEISLPAPSQHQPYGVRIVERYLTRSLPAALLGETVVTSGAPREVTLSATWTPQEGASGLHRRYRDWLAAEEVPDAASAVFRPVEPQTYADEWREFCVANLGVVPALADALRGAWQQFVDAGKGTGLAGDDLPADWPADPAQQDAWREFIDALPADVKRWLARWQGFLARRYVRIDEYRRRVSLNWPEFELIPAPDVLPANANALSDWSVFELRIEAMAATAHRFSVLLPTSGPHADAGALVQQIGLAERIAKVEKPAHTTFDVRQYWAMFRTGQARLGLDTLLGQGSRAPELAPQLVVGSGHVGASRIALRPQVPRDRVLMQC